MGRKQQGKEVTSQLGRLLVKNKRKKQKKRDVEGSKQYAGRHLTNVDDDNGAGKLQSVIERNDLDEFLCNALLAERDFTADRENIVVVGNLMDTHEDHQNKKNNAMDSETVVPESLSIPWRPHWDSSTTPEQLDQRENESFLEWRRTLANVEENTQSALTPFEKNLEVWRQLWRVVERSDVVVQIVDSRNPLLYRCVDLESYVHKMGKRCIFLVNKSDYLTTWQRNIWGDYFTREGIVFAFFSATTLDTLHDDGGTYPLLDRQSLLDWFVANAVTTTDNPATYTTVGMVGYPNVGKSSTINVLMNAKRVSVSATPGKTKHFQTLMLNERVCLCDCPGLVFPSLLPDPSELVLSGVVPLAQLRDHTAAMMLLVRRVSNSQLRHVYGLSFPPSRYTAPALLDAHARLRGFWKDHGRPNESRSARVILRDFVEGRLLYCHPPPSLSSERKVDFLRATTTRIAKVDTVVVVEEEAMDKQADERLDAEELTNAIDVELMSTAPPQQNRKPKTKRQERRRLKNQRKNKGLLKM